MRLLHVELFFATTSADRLSVRSMIDPEGVLCLLCAECRKMGNNHSIPWQKPGRRNISQRHLSSVRYPKYSFRVVQAFMKMFSCGLIRRHLGCSKVLSRVVATYTASVAIRRSPAIDTSGCHGHLFQGLVLFEGQLPALTWQERIVLEEGFGNDGVG